MAVDGGVLNPVPTGTVSEIGADKVIAIKVRGEAIAVEGQAEALPVHCRRYSRCSYARLI